MRTDGQIQGGLGYPDGQIFISALDMVATSGTATPTRNAAGSFSLNLAAGVTAVLAVSLSSLIFRYGAQDWLQEQFGSTQAGGAQGLPVGGYTCYNTANAAAGTNVSVTVNNTTNFTAGRAVNAGGQLTKIISIPDATHLVLQKLTATLTSPSLITENLFTTPASAAGVPPFSGISQLTPATSPIPKGIKIREIYPVYAIATGALSVNTIGITKTVFAPNVAPVVTNILANNPNGLAIAANAQPYLTPIMIANPAYLTSKYASYNIEWDITTTTGTAQVFGIYADVEYNYV